MVFCNKSNQFCFICGQYTTERLLRLKSEKFVAWYEKYYKSEWGSEEYVPQIGCSSCYSSLSRWKGRKHPKPKYKIPMTWFNPGEHKEDNCYFCINFYPGIKRTLARQYLGTDNAILPVQHNNDSPPLTGPSEGEQTSSQDDPMIDFDVEMHSDAEPSASTSSYVPPVAVNSDPILITQPVLNNMCRRLELSQRKSRLLTSILKEYNLLGEGVTITSQKNRQAAFIPHFATENDLTFCVNIQGLMEALEIPYDANDWRLFIDASKTSLKVVLLHNDHIYMPIPIAYSRILKETHASMKIIFEKIKYSEHNWDVSGDLKVVALIMGLQLGRTKNSCFICTWVSTAKINHYAATWEKRSSYTVGIMNVKEMALVSPEKILLPTLHIKLGLISSFIRKLNKEEEAFKYLKVLFPRLSYAKISAGMCPIEKCSKKIRDIDFRILIKFI